MLSDTEKKVIEAARRFYMLESAANKEGLRKAVRKMIEEERKNENT